MLIDSKNLMNKNLILFFKDKGFTEEEIIKTISDNSFFQYDYSKIDLIVKNSYDYLKEKGFSLEIIKKMTLRDPGFITTSSEKKRKIDECLEKLGISKNEIKKMIITCPKIYSYSEKRILDMVNYLISLGYSKEIAIFIIKKNPNIYSISIDSLNKFVDNIKRIGFSNKDILRIGKNYPAFWSKSFSKIKEVVNVLTDEKLGFTKNESLRIIVNASSILGYDIDRIIKKFNDLVDLGFGDEEIRKMIIELPSLIVSDIERTRMIIDFFTSINLRDKIKLYPKSFFMQSVETSYAKYCFYKERGVLIDENNFKRLFYGFSYYKKNYGIDKEELLRKYNYDSLLGNSKKKRIIS